MSSKNEPEDVDVRLHLAKTAYGSSGVKMPTSLGELIGPALRDLVSQVGADNGKAVW